MSDIVKLVWKWRREGFPATRWWWFLLNTYSSEVWFWDEKLNPPKFFMRLSHKEGSQRKKTTVPLRLLRVFPPCAARNGKIVEERTCPAFLCSFGLVGSSGNPRDLVWERVVWCDVRMEGMKWGGLRWRESFWKVWGMFEGWKLRIGKGKIPGKWMLSIERIWMTWRWKDCSRCFDVY